MARGNSKATAKRGGRTPAKQLQNTRKPGKAQKGGLQVRPVRNGKLTSKTAWQSNPQGGLKVSRNPVGSGTYNPQLGQPPLQSSYTSAPTRGR